MGIFDYDRNGRRQDPNAGNGMSPSPGFSAVLDQYAPSQQAAPQPMPQPAAPPPPSMASLGAPVDPVAEQERRAADMLAQGNALSGITATDIAVARARNIDPIEAAAARRYVGGQKAVTADDLQRMNQQATLVRTGGGMSTVGANRYNPDDIAELSQQRKMAGIQSNEAQQQLYDADVAGQQMAAGQLASAAASRQAEYGAKSAGLQNDIALAHKEEDAAANAEVNPGRFFASKGKFATAMLILASGLEKFANVKAGISGPTLVQQMIARDIQEQERSIVSRGAKARNRLGELYKQTGDLNDAKLRLEQEQKGALVAKMQADLAKTKSPAMKAQLEANLSEMLADLTGKRMEMDAANKGVTTETAQGQYLQPHAGRAGGWQYDPRALASASRDERKFRTENQLKVAEIEGKQQASGADKFTEYGNKRSELEKAGSYAEDILGRVGARRTESGYWEPTKDVAGYGVIAGRVDPGSLVGSAVLSPEGKLNRAQITLAKAQLINALSGAGVSDKERQMYDEMVDGAKTQADAVRGLGIIADRARTATRALEATYGTQNAQRYERQVGQASLRQSSKDADALQATDWTPTPVAPR